MAGNKKKAADQKKSACRHSALKQEMPQGTASASHRESRPHWVEKQAEARSAGRPRHVRAEEENLKFF